MVEGALLSESIQAELMRMADGDAISFKGTLKEAPSDTLASRSMTTLP
jgi:hypothetical protein